MPFNMILILYVIPCKMSCDFSKLPILYMYTCTYILSFLRQISRVGIIAQPGVFPPREYPGKPGLGNNAFLAKVGNNGQ